MTKISIIIPVYNVAEYLPQCLDSVINQTLRDIEIICINDGSTDNSLEILREYEKKDGRIKIIDKENEGQGVARNLGIDISTGEYIGFVDPDDYIEADMYKKMYNQAKKLDSQIVICDYRKWHEETDTKETPYFFIKSITPTKATKAEIIPGENIDKDILNETLLVSPCYSVNRIYASSLIKENSIRFTENACYEDVMFILKSHIIADRISYIDEAFYTYRLRKSSTLRSFEEKYLCLINAFENIKQYLCSIGMLKQFQKNYAYFVVMNTIWTWNGLKYRKNKIFLLKKSQEFINKKEAVCIKKFFIKKCLGKIFSIKRDNREHKVITIFGLKIKIFSSPQSKKASKIIKQLQENQKNYPKDTYLLFDRLACTHTEAIDAYSLFEYMRSMNKNVYYALLKDSQLYKKLYAEDRLDNIIGIDNFSRVYPGDFLEKTYDILLRTKCIISSFDTENKKLNKFFKNNKYWKYIFIQHGPTFLKESVFTKKYLTPDKFDKILISSSQEEKIFKKYGWKDNGLIKCGLPRWDLLKTNKNTTEKSILIMPTFRAMPQELFKVSFYWKSLLSLLTNEELKNICKEKNIALYFAPHHTLQDFGIDISLLNKFVNMVDPLKISEYIKKCSMLITDWSSVSFDFMFQNKPVIHYILDKGDPVLGKYDKEDIKNFDEKKKIIPNVFFGEKPVIEKVKYYIESDFQPEPEVERKYNEFFYTKENIRGKLTKMLNDI